MAQEATDERNNQEAMKTQEIEKARRGKEAEMKTQEKQRLAEKITTLEKSQKHTAEEKAAAEQYLKDLEPACIEGDSTYEDRKSARDDEIEALKEAQVILANAFQDNVTVGESNPPDANGTTLLQSPSALSGKLFLASVAAH